MPPAPTGSASMSAKVCDCVWVEVPAGILPRLCAGPSCGNWIGAGVRNIKVPQLLASDMSRRAGIRQRLRVHSGQFGFHDAAGHPREMELTHIAMSQLRTGTGLARYR